jgi:hypothetical protein
LARGRTTKISQVLDFFSSSIARVVRSSCESVYVPDEWAAQGRGVVVGLAVAARAAATKPAVPLLPFNLVQTTASLSGARIDLANDAGQLWQHTGGGGRGGRGNKTLIT